MPGCHPLIGMKGAFAVQQAVTRIQAYVRLGTRLKTASGGRVSDLSG
jgi:hypothetical protein